jgi:hypothetical protein
VKTKISLIDPSRAALLVAMVSAAQVSAGVSLISQTRTLDAEAKAIADDIVDAPPAAFKSAAGFGSFDDAVEPLALAVDVSPTVLVASAQGVAKQHSVLSLTSFIAKGEASVSLTLLPPANGLRGEASGESFFEVFFSLDEPMNFSLWGAVDTQAIVTGGADAPDLDNEVALVRTDDNTLIYTSGANDGALLTSGTLSPGNYRLWANAEVGASQSSTNLASRTVSGISEFDFRMVVTGIPEAGTYLSVFGLIGLVAVAGFRRSQR